ncbi:MAG: hypothetical protein KGZ75_07950 [Syntrophomonadaceae bacterium]|nr:hypothetical protein [Syntrophomonadaceae bacterium]
MAINAINLVPAKKLVDKCCKTIDECQVCAKSKCLVGFSKIALEYAMQKKALSIPQGKNLVPQGDMKIYYQEDLVEALAEILHQCQNCQDNHHDDCITNVARLALELALLGDNPPYGGSSFSYLIHAAKLHPEIGGKLLERYKAKKA